MGSVERHDIVTAMSDLRTAINALGAGPDKTALRAAEDKLVLNLDRLGFPLHYLPAQS